MQSIEPNIIVNSLTEFLKTTFTNAGFSNAVIGISGGVDSATSLGLATKALGSDHVFPLLMPYGSLHPQGVVDATAACREFGVPDAQITTIDIQPLVDPVISLDPQMDAVRKGNIMARMRMILLFDAAKKRNALVVGTENKTEHLLGYYTRFGDEASDVEPLRNLYKTQIYQVAKHMGVPESILTKAPTAGLWEGQTDEGEFGFSYKEADEILSLYTDTGKKKEEIVAMGYSEKVVERVFQIMNKNTFKHNLPYLPLK